MGETGIVNASNGRHLLSKENSHGRIALTRISKEKQLQAYIIKSGGKFACVCTDVCVNRCVYECVYVVHVCRCVHI